MDEASPGEYLEIPDPNGQSTFFELSGVKIILGRAEDAGIRLDFPVISREY